MSDTNYFLTSLGKSPFIQAGVTPLKNGDKERRYSLTEEINNLNTDLKELFVDSKFDRMKDILDKIADGTIIEITQYNFGIIKKYYEAQRYNILAQFIKFVAYSSFLCEYSVKRQLISKEEYEEMFKIFTEIYLKIKEEQE